MAVFPVLLAAVVALVTASPTASPPPADENALSCPLADQSQLFNLLQELGFSDSCVAAALDTCAVTAHDSQLVTLITDVRDLLQGVAQAVNTTQQEVRDLLLRVPQPVNTTLHEVRDLQPGVAHPVNTTLNKPRHCKDLLDAGDGGSGVRVIYPYPKQPYRRLAVYCDQTTDGGGWTVFQRRTNSTVREDFYRTWSEYKVGFGNLRGEFWLGLDPLHALTSTGQQELRIDLAEYDGGHRYAKYESFSVGDPATKYRLHVERYSGTAGDSLGGYHHGMMFSTHDSDNDENGGNCAQNHRGAWWYKSCRDSNLNGYQYEGLHTSWADGINWEHWRGGYYSMRHTAMMVRPAP